MPDDSTFRDLICRVRSGDDRAAAELVRLYEPAIRMVIRRRLTDPRLRRLLDSVDICQSVLGSFFVRVAAGQYELDTPEQLLKLLATMARNRLAHAVARQGAARRDYHRVQSGGEDENQLPDLRADPSRVVAGQELLHEVRRRLKEDERQLMEQRSLGRGWAEIAAEVGGTADGVRMRFSRALDRVSHELGLEE